MYKSPFTQMSPCAWHLQVSLFGHICVTYMCATNISRRSAGLFSRSLLWNLQVSFKKNVSSCRIYRRFFFLGHICATHMCATNISRRSVGLFLRSLFRNLHVSFTTNVSSLRFYWRFFFVGIFVRHIYARQISLESP